MSSIIIREYLNKDESILHSIASEKYAEALSGYSREKIKVAEYEGKVVGYSYASIRSGEGMMSFVFVNVSPEYRQHGIGSALYNEVEKRCMEVGSKAIFTSYYDKIDTDSFIKKHHFTYSTSSSFMKYSNGLIPETECNIRKYTDDDYVKFDDIWSRGTYEMHKRIGLPVSDLTGPNEDTRQQFLSNADHMYLFESDGQIVGVGSIDGANIGCLAVDIKLNNRGYGTTLAIFLTNQILKCGYSNAFLYCETGNDNARHIYENIGYMVLYTQYDSIKYL